MRKTLLWLFPAVLIHGTAFTQTQSTYLYIADNGSGSDTLRFGYAPGATCGSDALIPCEWIEPPPPPPAGVFDVRWASCLGGQGSKCDIRGYASPTDIDTHRVRFDGGFPVTFRWNPDSIRALCDSAWLEDEFGGFLFRVRMHLVDNYVYPYPWFHVAGVIRFGQRPPVSVVDPTDFRPQDTRLGQNYPNPFNPSTVITFITHSPSFTTLNVFDFLGQEIATPVNRYLHAGNHSVTFHGEQLPSGMYIYALKTAETTLTRKMLLVR